MNKSLVSPIAYVRHDDTTDGIWGWRAGGDFDANEVDVDALQCLLKMRMATCLDISTRNALFVLLIYAWRSYSTPRERLVQPRSAIDDFHFELWEEEDD